jgi:hypothetical protein
MDSLLAAPKGDVEFEFRASQLRVKRLEVDVDPSKLHESPENHALWSRLLSVFYPAELRVSCSSLASTTSTSTELNVFFDDDAGDFVGMVVDAVRISAPKRVVALEMPQIYFDRLALACALSSMPSLQSLEVARLSLQEDADEDVLKPHKGLRFLKTTMNEPMGRLWDLFEKLPSLESLDGQVVVWISSKCVGQLAAFMAQHGRLRGSWSIELSGQDSEEAIDLPPASHGPFRQVDALVFAEYGSSPGHGANYISTAEQLICMLHAAGRAFPRVARLYVFLSSFEMFASPVQCALVRSAFEVGWPHVRHVSLSLSLSSASGLDNVPALAQQAARCFPRRIKLSVSSLSEPVIDAVNKLNDNCEAAELVADPCDLPVCG